MLKHRWINIICIGIMVLTVVITILFMNGEALGLVPANTAPGYASRLFASNRVHTINLQVEDWDTFLEQAKEEEYVACSVTIDGETFHQVGLRAKGNNSLRLTQEYGLSRYSLKLEFDQFINGGNYYGLDKFSLDSSFQDNSYMKTWLTYDMMNYMGVPTPLCSYAQVTVNEEPWGLFLAVEEPEESFARRIYGDSYGKLYKPDYRRLEEENADVALRYIGDDPNDYDNIFRNTKFDITQADKDRLIRSLKVLSEGENLETVINVDEVLRYFAVQVFVMNPDSYLGPTGHNYFLYEEDGVLSILPWDYNLAFGTYCLGMSNPIKNPNILINYPVNTPWEGSVMMKRPLFHKVMLHDEYYAQYHTYMKQFVVEYVESGQCERLVRRTQEMIAPYVKKDVTAFCEYKDFNLAVDTLLAFCELRGESIQGQLEGRYPSTLREREENPESRVDASSLQLENLGDFEDLKQAGRK